MTDFTDIVKKALYLGVGLASYAGEQANQQLREIQARAQTLADEMVRRGEMSTEEARQWLESLIHPGMPPNPPSTASSNPAASKILAPGPEKEPTPTHEVEDLRRQVQELEAEVQRLRRL